MCVIRHVGGDVCRKRFPPAVLGRGGFQNPDREASIREVGSLLWGRVGSRGHCASHGRGSGYSVGCSQLFICGRNGAWTGDSEEVSVGGGVTAMKT